MRSRVQNGWTDQDAVWVVGSDGPLESFFLERGPEVLRNVAMATNFETQFAVTGFVVYNFGCMIPSDTLLDSRGWVFGVKIQWRHGRFRCSKRRCDGNHFFGFLYMACTLAPPGEYDWSVHVLRRCGLTLNYFDHLLLLHVSITRWYWAKTTEPITRQSAFRSSIEHLVF